ncbi:lamin tail domain-containing protein [Candidatus Pacearchaeota archaeon]|nr:lamin tail domain-containing protein [Candidatus Pacearchaeota archaeon]
MKLLRHLAHLISIFSLLILVACGGGGSSSPRTTVSDAEAVQSDVDNLAISFSGIDSTASVTNNLTLATIGSNGTVITWASNVPSVIAIDGTVARPAFGLGDAAVTLTATITKNAVTDTKIFSLTVIETPASDTESVAVDLAALTIIYSGVDSADSVTQNLGLSTTGATGTTIAWVSSDEGVISTNGIVVRPSFGVGSAVVTLTATIAKNGSTDTKSFSITVLEYSFLLSPNPTDITLGNTIDMTLELPQVVLSNTTVDLVSSANIITFASTVTAPAGTSSVIISVTGTGIGSTTLTANLGVDQTSAVINVVPYSPATLLINEVDYDQPGTDTTEFVEIYNISGSTIDLTDYQLVFVNGLDETVYLTTEPFAGSLLPGDYYVYGSSAVPGVDQTPLATETNIIQNGAPDGIRLERISTGEVIDSLAYEGTMTTAGEGSGDTGLADDGASDNVSLCRIPDGVDTDDNVADMMSCLSSPGVANSVSP